MTDPDTTILGIKLLENIQTGFIDKINASLHLVQGYASVLLYSLIIIELVLFGLMWAFRGDNAFGILIIKVIKIGIFISFIKYFPVILHVIIDGFTFVGFKIVSDKAAIYLFNPGKVWELGFQAGVSMMKLSVEYGTLNIGMSLIYLILGFGTLLLFAAIGAQIILVVSLFYIMALVVLLLAPFGILKPVEQFFYRSVQALIQAGVRVFTVIIILGVAYALWKTMKVTLVSNSTTLEKPLALFFTSFIFMILLYKLPPIIAEGIGKIGGNLFEGMSGGGATSVSVSTQTPPAMSPAAAQVSAASTVVGSMSAGGVTVASGGGIAASTSVVTTGGSAPAGAAPGATNVSISGGGAASSNLAGGKSKGVGSASSVNQSISTKTLSKLKSSV
jgi:P-type conjugative transfer protein TrbL